MKKCYFLAILFSLFLLPIISSAQTEEADETITICKGESVTLKGWHNVIECPCGASTQGPADCLPFPQPNGIWLVEDRNICDGSCIDITVQPTETTVYVNKTPDFQCPTVFISNAPTGPPPPSFERGPTITIKVIVKEDCTDDPSSPTNLTGPEGIANPENENLEASLLNLNQIFEEYTWLKDKVDIENCTVSSISTYQIGPFHFVYVQEAETGTLYFQDGTFYCTQTATYNCLEAYRLGTATNTWLCDLEEDKEEDTNITEATENPNDTTDETNDISSHCASHTGTIIFETCDDGRIFFFAKTSDNRILDIYFDDGVDFDYFEGQHIQFDYSPALFSSPCSVAEEAVIVTCIQEINAPNVSENDLFSTYPWLNDLIDPTSCTEERVEVYDLGSYAFIYVVTGDGAKIYNQDGVFYCEDLIGYSCVSAYSLPSPTDTWQCQKAEDCVCIALYDPVCGTDGKTYGNACEAACAGVEVLNSGECMPVTVPPYSCSILEVIDLIDNLCENCISEIAVYLYENDYYLVTLADNTQCADGLTTVVHCGTGDTFCNQGGIAGFNECVAFFETAEKIEIIAKEDCNTSCICPAIYDPVCGEDGKQYNNSCEAECAGVGIEAEGPCIPTCDCSPESAPVCGADGITYNNRCEADCAGVDILAEGQCLTVAPCICPAIYAPVCGADGLTYGNRCEAECEGVDIIAEGECNPTCNCPAIFEPVCGVDGLTYGNRCEADCKGVDILAEGECNPTCDCPGEFGPVCGVDGNTYGSRCEADCKGVDIISDGPCLSACSCSDEFDPVCGVDGITYPNACLAECEGVDIATSGACSSTTDCPILALTLFPDICESCIQEIAIYEFQGATYLVSFGSNDCSDAQTTVTTCDGGVLFCQDGGIAGFNQCEKFFEEAVKLSIILSKEGCENNCVCPEIYAPVCGEDGKTYDNKCMAECAGVSVVAEGNCDTTCVCEAIYAPVCGEDGKTYDNKCMAECAGVSVVAEGNCDTTCVCEAIYAPVCGEDGKTYNNRCEADCANVDIITIGPCVPTCICTKEYVPVCGRDGKTYDNKCLAECAGTEVWYTGPCFECDQCPPVDAPVCGVDGITYKNACEAECAHVEIAFEGSCETDCICTLEYAPVCGVDGITYGNACAAECAGVAIAADGECEPTCICPTVALPVCGVDGQTYGNECLAACAGVEVVYDGFCSATPCMDLAEVDFGDCEAIMGIAIVNGTCETISGCNDFLVNGINYERAFFPTVEICRQSCGGAANNPVFEKYPWLMDLVNPTDCAEETVSVFQSGVYHFIYIEGNGTSTLYFENGEFYCQDSPGLDCLTAYRLTNKVASWSCQSLVAPCINPLSQQWILDATEQECTGNIYSFHYNGQAVIYVQTLCACVDDSDKVFTCDGNFLCAFGRINPANSCMPNVADYLTDANLLWRPECNCECPQFNSPVCGEDGSIYESACHAACAGVVVLNEGPCLVDALTPPCHDLAGIDFGLCTAVMGVGIIDGTCKTISGCGNYIINGINYEQSFFPDAILCEQACNEDYYDALTPPCYDLAEVDFGPCDAVMGIGIINGACTTISGCGDFIFGGISYQESFFPTAELCLQACSTSGRANECEDPLSQDWLKEALNFTCTGKIYSIEYEGQAAIYIESLCGCVDGASTIFTCRGDVICHTSGRVPTAFFCKESIEELEVLIPENLIWTPACDCDCIVGPAVCGVDGITYESACYAKCAGVDILREGPCESAAVDAMDLSLFTDFDWLYNLVEPGDCEGIAISEFKQGNHTFIYVYAENEGGTLYYQDGTFYCQDSPNYNCLEAYKLKPEKIQRTWTCNSGMVYDGEQAAISRSIEQATFFTEAITLYPNPTPGQFHIQLKSTSKEPKALIIYDLYGRVIVEETIEATSSEITIPINLTTYKDGLYMVTLRERGQRVAHKTIIKTGLE